MGRARASSILEGRAGGRSPALCSEEELCRRGIHMRQVSRGHLGKFFFSCQSCFKTYHKVFLCVATANQCV